MFPIKFDRDTRELQIFALVNEQGFPIKPYIFLPTGGEVLERFEINLETGEIRDPQPYSNSSR